MHQQWQSFLEFLWPSRGRSLELQRRRDALLYATIAIAISLFAGPEFFAAMEMTMLLELLGATLFLTAFGAGARLAAQSLWIAACSIALPAPQVAVMRSDASALAKALALTHVSAHVTWCLVLPFIVGSWGRWVMELAA
jgi:hypothetical protein